MKKLYLLIFSISVSLAIKEVKAQNPNPDANLDATISAEMNTRNFPGASTVIVKNGEIVWLESYGYADVDNSVLVTDSTAFLMASVSKLFTGTAGMLAKDQNILDLDRDINNYISWNADIPNFINDSITMRRLMTHTGSIDDNWGTMSSFYGYPDPTISLSSCIENYFSTSGSNYSASNNFLNSAPGTAYDYSNMGTALSAYIIQEATNQDFNSFCNSNLFEPLCMNNTGWYFSDFDSSLVARPHSYDNGSYSVHPHYGFADYPNGQLRSTAKDLGHFMIGFLEEGNFNGNQWLSSSSIQEMLTTQIPSINANKGLNWTLTELFHNSTSSMLWGHSGGELGVSTYMYIDPVNEIGICLLTNGEGEGLYICDALYEHALGLTPSSSLSTECTSNNLKGIESSIRIFPNPSNGIITIQNNLTPTSSCLIYNGIGELVHLAQMSGNNQTIDLSFLKSGIYLLKTNLGEVTKILIK